MQDFGGDNLRLHARGNVIHTLSDRHGLSAQLRVRYFHDSHANESDYFAPGWHAQAIPTLQVRRFVNGWRYAVAAGYGAQRDADTSWRPARSAVRRFPVGATGAVGDPPARPRQGR